MKKFAKRLVSILATMMMIFSSMSTSYAAGVETWNAGFVDIGTFTFNDENTTPVKTVNGTSLTINVRWRRADGLYGAPNGDQGIGDVKLTMQILDSAGNALTSKQVFYFSDDGTGYSSNSISLNVPYGQKIKIWFDASSVNPATSNGKYRSIYVKDFWAFVQ